MSCTYSAHFSLSARAARPSSRAEAVAVAALLGLPAAGVVEVLGKAL
jgi:hypothetical protein